MKAKANPEAGAKTPAPETKEDPIHIQKLKFTQELVKNGMGLINSLKAQREAALARTKLDEFAMWAQVAIATDVMREQDPPQGQ